MAVNRQVMAERITALRGDLSKSKLAKRLGIRYQTIIAWENGKSTPDSESLVKMAEMYSVPAMWILGLSDDRARPHSSNAKNAAASPAELRRLKAAFLEWAGLISAWLGEDASERSGPRSPGPAGDVIGGPDASTGGTSDRGAAPSPGAEEVQPHA